MAVNEAYKNSRQGVFVCELYGQLCPQGKRKKKGDKTLPSICKNGCFRINQQRLINVSILLGNRKVILQML